MSDTVTIIDAWGRPVSVSAEDAVHVPQRSGAGPTLLQRSFGMALVICMTVLLSILCIGRFG